MVVTHVTILRRRYVTCTVGMGRYRFRSTEESRPDNAPAGGAPRGRGAPDSRQFAASPEMVPGSVPWSTTEIVVRLPSPLIPNTSMWLVAVGDTVGTLT